MAVQGVSVYEKSSSSSGSGSMSSGTLDDVEFPVFVGGCQKWITGLTKRTTCDDVIYALLMQEHNPNDVIDVQCFAIFERWRGVERSLRGRTKIIKIWRAWGSERENVKFSVRKISDPMDTSSEVSRGKKTRRHHPAWRDRNRRNQDADKHSCERCYRGRECPKHQNHPAPPHAKKDKHGKHDKQDKFKAKAFHDLVHRILEQEKMIQEQLLRIKDTDSHIENYETKVHMARMKENGENYVQEAYLKDSDSSCSGDDLFPAIKANDLEAYARICDNILELEQRISSEETKILDLSVCVQEESMLSLPPELPQNSDLVKEIESLRKEVHKSINLSTAHHQQSQLVMDTVQDTEWQMQRKQAMMHSLVAQLNDLPSLASDDEVADNDAIDSERYDRRDGSDNVPASDSPDHGYNEMPVDCDFAFLSDSRDDDSPPPVPPPPSVYGYHYEHSKDSFKSQHEQQYHYNYYNHKDYTQQQQYAQHQSQQNRSNGQQPNRDSGSNGLPTIPEHPLPPPKPPRLNISPPVEMVSSDLPFYVTKVSSNKDYQWKNNSDNDSNSDTGLSSLHSDESPAILETLV